MSFTVSRRTREIGIRVDLGANPGRIIAGVFRGAFLQIGAGVLIGSTLAALGGLGFTREVLLLLAADAIMLGRRNGGVRAAHQARADDRSHGGVASRSMSTAPLLVVTRRRPCDGIRQVLTLFEGLRPR